MIIGCDPDKPRAVGERYQGVWLDGTYHAEKAWVVLRPATLSEWLRQQWAAGESPEPDSFLDSSWFYDVDFVDERSPGDRCLSGTTGTPAARDD